MKVDERSITWMGYIYVWIRRCIQTEIKDSSSNVGKRWGKRHMLSISLDISPINVIPMQMSVPLPQKVSQVGLVKSLFSRENNFSQLDALQLDDELSLILRHQFLGIFKVVTLVKRCYFVISVCSFLEVNRLSSWSLKSTLWSIHFCSGCLFFRMFPQLEISYKISSTETNGFLILSVRCLSARFFLNKVVIRHEHCCLWAHLFSALTQWTCDLCWSLRSGSPHGLDVECRMELAARCLSMKLSDHVFTSPEISVHVAKVFLPHLSAIGGCLSPAFSCKLLRFSLPCKVLFIFPHQ